MAKGVDNRQGPRSRAIYDETEAKLQEVFFGYGFPPDEVNLRRNTEVESIRARFDVIVRGIRYTKGKTIDEVNAFLNGVEAGKHACIEQNLIKDEVDITLTPAKFGRFEIPRSVARAATPMSVPTPVEVQATNGNGHDMEEMKQHEDESDDEGEIEVPMTVTEAPAPKQRGRKAQTPEPARMAARRGGSKQGPSRVAARKGGGGGRGPSRTPAPEPEMPVADATTGVQDAGFLTGESVGKSFDFSAKGEDGIPNFLRRTR